MSINKHNRSIEYHVGCGLAGIYAGTLKNDKEWRNKNEVTDEAVLAVANYMYSYIPKGKHSLEIPFKTEDGKSIVLKLEVKKQKEKKNDIQAETAIRPKKAVE